MSHYLILAMDTIIGQGNFRNEITWQRHSSLDRGRQQAPRTSDNTIDTIDTIVVYAGSEAELRQYRPMKDSERPAHFPLVDATGQRFYYVSAHILKTRIMGTRPNLCCELRGFINPHPSV